MVDGLARRNDEDMEEMDVDGIKAVRVAEMMMPINTHGAVSNT